MDQAFDIAARRDIRAALARTSFAKDSFRLVDGDMRGFDWLVATHRGLFAVSDTGPKLVAHGWFFGLRASGTALYLFENCALRQRDAMLGRLLRLDLHDGQVVAHHVLAKGLHPNCHQLAIIGDVICLLDTANQAILRFTLDGTPLSALTPFGAAQNTDTSGAYHHINAIAEIAGRIAVLLHNGKVLPERSSQIAWFDHDWTETGRDALHGRMCHDLVTDPAGTLWYCGSLDGDIVSERGQRVHVADDYLTRGLAFGQDMVAVGYSSFGPRHIRDGLRGGVAIMDRAFKTIKRFDLDGPPTEITPIR